MSNGHSNWRKWQTARKWDIWPHSCIRNHQNWDILLFPWDPGKNQSQDLRMDNPEGIPQKEEHAAVTYSHPKEFQVVPEKVRKWRLFPQNCRKWPFECRFSQTYYRSSGRNLSWDPFRNPLGASTLEVPKVGDIPPFGGVYPQNLPKGQL